jgi:hypothetical protein
LLYEPLQVFLPYTFLGGVLHTLDSSRLFAVLLPFYHGRVCKRRRRAVSSFG